MTYAKPAKAVAMGGDAAQTRFIAPEDYRFWNNRAWISLSETPVVRFWVSWAHVQPSQPADMAGSWNALNTAVQSPDYIFGSGVTGPVPYLQKLDRQIRAANDDGKFVILTVDQYTPTWAASKNYQETRTHAPDPLNPPPYKVKDPYQSWPADLTVNSPYGWFIGHICARYSAYFSAAAGQLPNWTGPHFPGPGETSSAFFGNPSGAYINALEISNEPNHFQWPQVENLPYPSSPPTLTSPYYVGQMAAVAKTYANGYAWPPLLVGGTLDTGRDNYTPPYTTGYDEFNELLLELLALGGFPSAAATTIGFSQHNYGDIKYQRPYGSSFTFNTWIRLGTKGWPMVVWLTEGGLDPDGGGTNASYAGTSGDTMEALWVGGGYIQMDQFNLATNSTDFPIYTNHAINDQFGNSTNTAVRDAFVFWDGVSVISTNPALTPLGPGASRLLEGTWPNF